MDRSIETQSDNRATVASLKELVSQFVDERDWHQFHSPKNLSMAMAIEVGELMEHFQWINPDESRSFESNPEKKHAIGEELADVLCYCFALANELNIDIATAMHQKMQKNREKYPADQYKGRYGPEDSGQSANDA